jgi:hypothetical protein
MRQRQLPIRHDRPNLLPQHVGQLRIRSQLRKDEKQCPRRRRRRLKDDIDVVVRQLPVHVLETRGVPLQQPARQRNLSLGSRPFERLLIGTALVLRDVLLQHGAEEANQPAPHPHRGREGQRLDEGAQEGGRQADEDGGNGDGERQLLDGGGPGLAGAEIAADEGTGVGEDDDLLQGGEEGDFFPVGAFADC